MGSPKSVTAVVVAKLCRELAAQRWKTLSSDLRPVRRHGPNSVRPSGQVLNVSLTGKTYISDTLLYPRPFVRHLLESDRDIDGLALVTFAAKSQNCKYRLCTGCGIEPELCAFVEVTAEGKCN